MGLTYIEEKTFIGLDKLIYLSLTDNKITILEKDTFNGLSNISILSLGENKIHHVHKDCFRHLTKLIVLEMANNNIQTLSTELLHEQIKSGTLKTLRITNNPGLNIDKQIQDGRSSIINIVM